MEARKETRLEKIIENTSLVLGIASYGSMIISPLVYGIADSLNKNLPYRGEIFLSTTTVVSIVTEKTTITDNFNPVPGGIQGVFNCVIFGSAFYGIGRLIGLGLEKITN